MADEQRVEDRLGEILDLEDEEILTHWVIAYETKGADGRDNIGYLTSVACTPWNASGLMVWASLVMKKKELSG